MKNLHFNYEMLFTFSEPVSRHSFTYKCIPVSTGCQNVKEVNLTITPAVSYTETADSFGNKEIYGIIEEPHEQFCVSVSGSVITGLQGSEEALPPHRLGMFRYPSDYTHPGIALNEYMASLSFGDAVSAYDRGVFLMHRLHQDISYEKGITSYLTTAEEAMGLSKGVCQDYAHILIALLRMMKIPARYVVGMMEGEGFSPAWVEMEADGRWYGLDPTNDVLVGDRYIKISHGRDYNDCIVNKGVFTGTASQKQQIRVIVHEQ